MEDAHPLKKWREANGLTQSALGAEVGVLGSQISQIEAGTKGASLSVALKIAALSKGAVPLEALQGAKAAL